MLKCISGTIVPTLFIAKLDYINIRSSTLNYTFTGDIEMLHKNTNRSSQSLILLFFISYFLLIKIQNNEVVSVSEYS